MRAPDATVVVPTRDRPESLGRCLAALAAQRGVPRLEVVVVDDGSRDATAVAAALAALPAARLLHGHGRGPAAARNHGTRAARAPVVLFLDDDCRPAPDWAALLAGAIAAGAAAAAGSTVNARPGDPWAAASQAMTNHLADAGGDPFAASNNLACRSEVARALPFDPGYPDAAGEDREWCARLAAAGHELVPEPRALVRHEQRLGARGFARQQLRYGRGAFRFRTAGAAAGRRDPAAFYLGLVRAGFRAGVRAGLLVVAAQGLVAAGYADAAVRARASRRSGASADARSAA